MRSGNVVLTLVIALLAAGNTSKIFAQETAVDAINVRGGIPRSLARFDDSQAKQVYTKISYFGGTATTAAGLKPGSSFRELFQRHVRSLYPKGVLSENQAWVSDTGSWLGAFRARTDAMYGGAALVIVEFAADDGGQPREQTIAAVEGIVRQLLGQADIVLLYAPSRENLAAYGAGQTPEAIAAHEAVAAHYNLPSLNAAKLAAEKIKSGQLKPEEALSEKGQALIGDALKDLLARCKSAPPAAARKGLPKPLSPAAMEKAQCVAYDLASIDSGWKVGMKTPVERFLHVLQSDKPGAALTLKFRGAACGLYDAVGPDSGDVECSIDGGPWQKRPVFSAFSKSGIRTSGRPLAQGLDPKEWHELRLRVAADQPAGSTGRVIRIGYLLVDGEIEDPLKGLEPLARIDAIYAKMAPLDYTPPAVRFGHLAGTMKRLREGPSLKIVMLGDSIIGDTSSSRYELLLQRLYPKCKVDKVTSVRGSTGCWWYKDDNRVQDYVLRHEPDLLMIGGISQRGDIDAIRSVIQQVRAKSKCDILLMTPAFGALVDPHIKTWAYAIDPAGTDYRAQLQKLAQEEKCEFIDMTGPWWKYIQESGKDYGYFQRDRVHANDRGFQILGRVLEKYFTPIP